MNRIAQRAALRNRKRRRLLQVNVLACPYSIYADQRVPMVRRAYYYCVDVLVRQQLVIVRISGYAVVGLARLLRVEVVDQLFAVLDAMRIQIAYCHDSCPVVGQQQCHIVAARDASCADTPNVDAFAWRILSEDSRRHNRGKPHRSHGANSRL